MIQIDDTVISLDLFSEKFICDLSSCKGQCCVDGDAGAPLEAEEVDILKEILPHVWNDLSSDAQDIINQQGVAYLDTDGEMVTSIVYGKDCVFTYYDENGYCKCAIEKAFKEGRISYYKPISCHLYPVRIQKHRDFRAVNYHRWSVCKPAILLGAKVGMPVYQFLKVPLIRKFGQAWFDEMEVSATELKAQGLIE